MVPGGLIGAGAGAGLGLLGGLFGGGGGGGGGGASINAGRQYLNQVPQIANNYYAPYRNEGWHAAMRGDENLNQMDRLYDRGPVFDYYNRLTRDPQGYMNEIMRGYRPSEGYQYKLRKMLEQQRAGASAGGFVGTPQDTERQADITRGLLGQDQQEWINNIFGAQNTGAQGATNLLGGRERAALRKAFNEQLREERGYTANEAMANMLAGNMQEQAGLGIQAGQQRERSQANRRRELMSLIGSGLGAGMSLGAGGGNFF